MLRKIYQGSIHGLIITFICAAYVQSIYQGVAGPL
jgi:hypothetical protein